MTSPTLTISGKVLGKSQNLFTSWQMALPERPLTLAELLTEIVTAEVRAFGDRQSERRITNVLGLVEIEAGVALGKISSGGSELEQVVDERGRWRMPCKPSRMGFIWYLSMTSNRRI